MYSADPVKQPEGDALCDASPSTRCSTDKLNVMDATAIVMCRDNDLPLRVFNLNNAGDLPRIVRGEDVGTVVTVAASAVERRMLEDIKKDATAAHGQVRADLSQTT